MKSVPVARIPHKDDSEYLLISISFIKLLLEICLAALFEY